MTEDLLERATKALREQGGAEPPSDRAAFMRARVLSQAKRSSKLRPQGIWQWAAVVSLGFFVSTAMAQVIAVQLPRVIEALRRENVEEAKPKKAAPKRAAKPLQPLAAPAAASGNNEPVPSAAASGNNEPVPSATPSGSAEPTPRAAEAPAAPSVSPAPPEPVAALQPRRAQRRLPKPALSAKIPAAKPTPPPPAAIPEPEPEAAPAAAPEAPQPKAAAPESAELALFRRAQALHTAHDPRAIAAWDAFLRVAGASVLAPEARYNRALGLVRASRFEEARRALKPFAAGAYGSYRKQEAQALLARLPE